MTVSTLPNAYEQVYRNKFNSSKLWWITSQVSALTRGYYSSLIRFVKSTAESCERKSLKLIENNFDRSPEEFAKLLYDNSEKIICEWRELYEKLIVQHDMGYNLKYAKRHEPKNDAKKIY